MKLLLATSMEAAALGSIRYCGLRKGLLLVIQPQSRPDATVA
ncbi:MAG: hypothetical protein ACXV2B_06330 [Halobacteriota archaeon]